VTSNEAHQTVTAQQSPALTLVKIASPTTYSATNQTITYTYVVTNSGNVDQIGRASCRERMETATCTGRSKEMGVSITCTASYTILQTDRDARTVTNRDWTSDVYSSELVTSNEAHQTVTAQQSPALTLVKIASPTTYSATNQTITYTYVVTNSGNVD